MDTDGHRNDDAPHAGLTREIIGAAFEVINALGHGLHEKPYENALVIELRQRGLQVDQQRRFPIAYKGVPVGEYVPDVLVENAVVVDTKTIDRITAFETGQMLNYLKITRCRVGLILNFKRPKLGFHRLVL